MMPMLAILAVTVTVGMVVLAFLLATHSKVDDLGAVSQQWIADRERENGLRPALR